MELLIDVAINVASFSVGMGAFHWFYYRDLFVVPTGLIGGAVGAIPIGVVTYVDPLSTNSFPVPARMVMWAGIGASFYWLTIPKK